MKFRPPNRSYTLDLSLREWLFYRLCLRAGRTEGSVVPRWLHPVWFAADPMCFVRRWFGCNHHVPNYDLYLIEGEKYSGFFFRQMRRCPLPGPWIRMVRREDGVIEWEIQKDGRDT